MKRMPLVATGLGSLFNIHPTVDKHGPLIRKLLYFHCNENGVYIAARGLAALSLLTSGDDTERFLGVVQDFVTTYRDVLVRS